MVKYLKSLFKKNNIVCEHDWVENHKHPMFHATRFCKKCGIIQIRAMKIEWCNNYANINLKEAKEMRKYEKFQV